MPLLRRRKKSPKWEPVKATFSVKRGLCESKRTSRPPEKACNSAIHESTLLRRYFNKRLREQFYRLGSARNLHATSNTASPAFAAPLPTPAGAGSSPGSQSVLPPSVQHGAPSLPLVHPAAPARLHCHSLCRVCLLPRLWAPPNWEGMLQGGFQEEARPELRFVHSIDQRMRKQCMRHFHTHQWELWNGKTFFWIE